MKKFRYPLIIFVLALDQFVKYLIRANFEVGESKDIVSNILSLTYVRNKGVAFSMLNGKGLILIIIPIVISIIAIAYMEMRKNEHWTLYTSISLIVSGGIGNVIDRIIFGYVTDMFDVHFWPVFNVADIAICIGCGFLIIYVLAFMDKEVKNQLKAEKAQKNAEDSEAK